VTSSPGGSGSPTGVNAEVDSRPYLDDDFTQERIIDVDLLPLVLPPYGVDYNEWLATHSTYISTSLSLLHALSTNGSANSAAKLTSRCLVEILFSSEITLYIARALRRGFLL